MGEERGFRAHLRRFRLSLLGSCQSKRRPGELASACCNLLEEREIEERV